jgi:hypothetical protein
VHSPTLAPAFGVTALADTNYQTEQVSDYEAAYWGPNYERLQQVCMMSTACWLTFNNIQVIAAAGSLLTHVDVCQEYEH